MLKGNHPRKKLPALNQLFFIETECTFPTGANHAWDVACPIGTQSPAHIQPCDPFYRAPRRRRLYQLFFARHHGGKPWQKSDDHQTQGTACQQSGSIQSIYCFRGHFHVLVFFVSHCRHCWDSHFELLIRCKYWIITLVLSKCSYQHIKNLYAPEELFLFFKSTIGLIFRKVDVKASNFWLYYNCAVINCMAAYL